MARKIHIHFISPRHIKMSAWVFAREMNEIIYRIISHVSMHFICGLKFVVDFVTLLLLQTHPHPHKHIHNIHSLNFLNQLYCKQLSKHFMDHHRNSDVVIISVWHRNATAREINRFEAIGGISKSSIDVCK